MRLSIVGLALTTCLAAFTSSVAQEAKNQNDAYEHLKELEWMVGEWTAELDDDGQVVTLPVTCEWLHSKKFVRCKWQGIRRGEVLWEQEVTWYWDPVEKVVRYQSFQDSGMWGRATAEVSGGSIRGKINHVSEKGERIAFDFSLKRTGPDSFTWWEDEGPGVVEFRRKE